MLETALLLLAMLLLLVCYCTCIAMIGFCVYANWKLFIKMGEPGWKSIIPGYSTIVLYKHIWNISYGIATLVLGYVWGMFLSLIYLTFFIPPLCIVIVILISPWAISCLVYGVKVYVQSYIRYAKAFGHGGGFAVGLIFAPFVFLPILAFGKSKYIGNPCYPAATSDENNTQSNPI